LYSTDNSNDRTVAKAYLKRNVQWLDNARLDELICSGDAQISMLADACEDLSLERKRQISSRVARQLDKALIIRGTYEVMDSGLVMTVKIERTILVPRKSRRLEGYADTSDALNRLGKVNLMSKPEAYVAIQHFGDDTTLPGVVFPPPDSSYREALISERKKVELFVITDPRKTQPQLKGNETPVASSAKTGVFYRPITVLKTPPKGGPLAKGR
jgi:hypothetical protein